MNKLYFSVAALLLSGSIAMAQSPANRTNSTIIADVVAQMPAKQIKAYDKLMSDLASTGEEGVIAIVKMINPPGPKSNASQEFALHSLTYYVVGLNDEAKRTTLSNAYLKALEMVSDREIKAFIIRQIEIVGSDECVEAISAYLHDESLSGPAARVLSAVRTEKSNQALIAALKMRRGSARTQENIAVAIGESKLAGAEDVLLAMVETTDVNLKKTLLYALSQVGTTKSLKVLSAEAEKAGYAMETTGANEAYISLVKRIAASGDSKTALAEAKKLFKKATKAQMLHSKEAAAQIIMATDKNVDKFIVKAMKEDCMLYRNAVLTFASKYADAELYIELLNIVDKKQSPANIDIVNWIGREAACPEKYEIIKNLELKFDRTAYQCLAELAQSNDFATKQAAIWTIVKLKHRDFIPALANMLASADEQVILLAQDALYAFDGNINEAVASIIPQATDKGKICALELLANRMADAQLKNVLEQTKASSSIVKEAAYKALHDVVTPKDFVQTCGILETCDTNYVPFVQEAVIAAMKDKSAKDKVMIISKRMLQAGESKKHLYYKVLATTGEADALETIVKGFNTSNGAAKDAAFEALLAWKGAEVASELFAIAESTPNYLDAALKAYVKLVSNPSFTGENRLLSLRKAMDVAKTDEQKNIILRQIGNTGTFLGMIFAYEYIDNAATKQEAAVAVKNIALGNKSFFGSNVREMLTKVSSTLSHQDAHYDRDAIKKHLSEMPQGEGFVSMFNGKNLDGWKGLVQNPYARAKMSATQLAKAQTKADETMRKEWKVTPEGYLMFDGKSYDNLCSVKQYGDFEMYIDWMLDPAGPEADAGLYLRGTPQVQIWDTSRVNVGAQVGSGGLYNNAINPSKPLKVADNKLGEWNTFYIKMVGDRVTVYLNGELVTDNVILENFWDRKQPIFPVEQIELQAHGSKVFYRDIYINELERPEPFKLSAEEEKEGFEVLFDGTNMHQWQGNTVDYAMEDGVISLTPSKNFGGNLYTKKEYDNFNFRFEFQLTPGANNGLGIRTPMNVDAAYHGMELQILDNDAPIYKDLKVSQYHGSVYGIIAAKRGFLKPLGEWNEQEVIADGDNIKVILNGHVIVDGNLKEATKNGTLDGLEHPGLFNKKGYIGFLGHGNPLKFRNIRVKELK